MKFSIIIAVYNGSATLQHCLDSISAQTCSDYELILMDGASTDGTLDIIDENRSSFSYWESKPDHGIYHAWNKALVHCHGEWILFLGADDYLYDENVLEMLGKRLAAVPEDINVAYGKVQLVDQQDSKLSVVGSPWSEAKRNINKFMSIPHQGVLHRRTLFDKYGNFDESFRIAGDYEFLLRDLKTSDAMFFPDVIVTTMREGGISSTPDNFMMMILEKRRAQRIHGQFWMNGFILKAIATEFTRRVLWKVLGGRLASRLLDFRRKLRGLPPRWTKDNNSG